MYKELKTELDDKKINDILIKGKSDRIKYKLQKQLGLKSANYSEAKLEVVGMSKNDKFINAFASVEKLDKEVEVLKGENKIIDNTIDDVSREIDKMKDNEKSVFKCRYILGLTQEKTAEKLSYSLIRVKQLDKEISKKI